MQPDVDDYLRGPVAALMFAIADASGVRQDDLAQPECVTSLAALAIEQLSPWSATAPPGPLAQWALATSKPLASLMERTVTDPRNGWWHAPIALKEQLAVEQDLSVIRSLRRHADRNKAWEAYAQRPQFSVRTSTELRSWTTGIRSGIHAELAYGVGDWAPEYPLRQARVEVDPSARIYEVSSARSWAELAMRYPMDAGHALSSGRLSRSAGFVPGPSPDWDKVAADWAGVHLSFAGLLTALMLPVALDGTTTTLWSWECECTQWLRPVLRQAAELPLVLGEPDLGTICGRPAESTAWPKP